MCVTSHMCVCIYIYIYIHICIHPREIWLGGVAGGRAPRAGCPGGRGPITITTYTFIMISPIICLRIVFNDDSSRNTTRNNTDDDSRWPRACAHAAASRRRGDRAGSGRCGARYRPCVLDYTIRILH